MAKCFSKKTILVFFALFQAVLSYSSVLCMQHEQKNRKRKKSFQLQDTKKNKKIKRKSKQNLFSRAFTKTQNFIQQAPSTVTDALINCLVSKPTELWFSGIGRREQERIIFESQKESLAHEQFRKIHGDEKYNTLLNTHGYGKYSNQPLHWNPISKPTPMAAALMLLAHLPLPHIKPCFSNSETFFEQDDNVENDTSDLNQSLQDINSLQPQETIFSNSLVENVVTHDFISTQWLDHYAIDLGLGYKTANMTALRELTKAPLLQNLPGNIHIAVPEFVGVRDSQIKNFLNNRSLNIEDEWKALIHEIPEQDKKDFVLKKEMLIKFEKLADKIQEQFEQMAQKIESEWTGLLSFFNFGAEKTTLSSLGFDKEIDELIALCVQENAFITVRSSGREDTEELANAGGNVSNEIVMANSADVLRGMGIVVSSYFRSKSLGQRALLKDSKLFDVPLMPVLVQRVVAEKQESEFSGCVAYTREPQGNLPSITLTQCTHGHTKGVVDSLVPLDTFICNNGNCQSIIKDKPDRYAPISRDNKKFALDRVPNDEKNRYTSSLTSIEQQALQKVLCFIERVYSKPMDLELSFDHKSKTIYIYQARPLVIKNSQQLPSYLVDDHIFKNHGIHEIITCTTMSQAGGATRLVKANQIIAQKTLDDALNFYLEQKNKLLNFDFDLIIVQHSADPTSHAAATFNGMAKPIMIAHNYDLLSEWLKHSDETVLADVQTGRLYRLTGTNFSGRSLQAIKAQGLIKEGLRSYPIPQLLSVPENTATSSQLTHYAQLTPSMENSSLDELVEILKAQEPQQANQALNTILHKLAKQIMIKKNQATCPNNQFFDCPGALALDCPLAQTVNCLTKLPAQEALHKLNKLFIFTVSLAKKIRIVLNEKPFTPQRLFYINFLEALLFQNPNKEIINNYSLKSVLEQYHETIRFIKNNIDQIENNAQGSQSSLASNQKFLNFAQHGSESAFVESVKNDWLQFIDCVANNLNDQDQQAVASMIDDINNLNMLPTWLNTQFVKHNQQPHNEMIKQLLAEYEQDKIMLQKINSYNTVVNHINPGSWSNEKQFQALHDDFNEKIFSWFSGQELAKIIKNPQEHQLAYQAALVCMSNFVEKFDLIIKAIKSSSQMNPTIKIANFKSIIQRYLNLLENWAYLVPKDTICHHEYFSLNSYLQQLRKVFNECSDEAKELLPSRDFVVGPATLGSCSLFAAEGFVASGEIVPRTLEDIFTTVHQSLLVILSALNTSITIPMNAIPKELLLFNNFFLDKEFKGYRQQILKAKLTGFNFEKNNITYHYNITLRDHSAKILLTYLPQEKALNALCSFYGKSERQRWQHMKIYGELINSISDSHKFFINKASLNDNTIHFSVSELNVDNAPIFLESLEKMIQISYFNYDYIKTIWNHIKLLPNKDLYFKKFIEKIKYLRSQPTILSPELQESVIFYDFCGLVTHKKELEALSQDIQDDITQELYQGLCRRGEYNYHSQ